MNQFRPSSSGLIHVWCLVMSLFAVAVVSAAVSPAQESIGKGRASLALQTPQGLGSAAAHFATALEAEPGNLEANLLEGAVLILLEQSSPALQQQLSAFGVTVTNPDIYNFEYGLPYDREGHLRPRQGATSGTMLAFLGTRGPLITRVLGNLSKFGNDPLSRSFRTTLSAQETSLSGVRIDYGDVLILRSLLKACEGILALGNSHNLQGEYARIYHLFKQGLLSPQRVLTEFPELLRFADKTRRQSAVAAFVSANADYQAGYAFTKGQRLPAGGTPYLFEFPDPTPADDFASELSIIVRSLDRGTDAYLYRDFYPSFLRGLTFNPSAFFSSAKPLRDYAGSLFVQGFPTRGSWPDDSFGGLLPESYSRGVLLDELDLVMGQLIDTDGDGLSDSWERGYGRYQIVEQDSLYHEALADAQRRRGHLATFTSETEWDWFWRRHWREVRSPLHIGLSLGATPGADWAWHTGEGGSFRNWSVGYPEAGFPPMTAFIDAALGWKSLPDAGFGQGNHGGPWFAPWTDSCGYVLERGYPTDKSRADTDNDGFNDGVETQFDTDPNNASSYPVGLSPLFAPVISSPAAAYGFLNTPFTYQITASNFATTYDASPLPTGLSVNFSTGLIAGIPRQAGNFAVSLSARNAAGRGTAGLSLSIGPAPSPTPPPAQSNAASITKGLVAWYPMFGGSISQSNIHTLLLDSSSNSNHAIAKNVVISNAALWHGRTNFFCHFGGSNSYAEAETKPYLSPYPMTVSCWFKTSEYTSNAMGALVNKYHVQSWSHGYNLAFDGDGSRVAPWYIHNPANAIIGGYSGVGAMYPTNAPFVSQFVGDSKWRQITVTFDDGGGVLYMNGSRQTNHAWIGSPMAIVQNPYPLSIGRYLGRTHSEFFKGSIANVRIYSRALSAEEVSRLYASDMELDSLSEGIIAYYPLAGDALDHSTNANDGTAFNAVPTTDRYGVSNCAYFFNGSNSYIQAVHQPHLNVLPITISCWFAAVDPPTASGALVSKYYASGWNGYGLFWGSGVGQNVIGPLYAADYGNDISDGYGGTNPLFHSSAVNDTNWHMVTFAADTNGGTLYIDGVVNTNHAWRGLPMTTTSSDPLLIGKYQYYPQSTSTYFRGSISDVIVYNRALSSSEVAGLYSIDVPRPLPPPEPVQATVDSIAPTLRVTSPPTTSMATRRQKVTFLGSASDNLSPTAVQIRLKPPGNRNFGPWIAAELPGEGSTKSWLRAVALVRRGNWTLQFRAVDASGNFSSPRTIVVRRL